MQETSTVGRRLVIMRHAKAESGGASDHARRLTETGYAAASSAGRWLSTRVETPDHAIVSDAVRTTETWQAVTDAAGWTLEHEPSPALYAAEPETALELIRAVPADVSTLVLIGHNPTVAFLAERLDDGSGDPAATAELLVTGYRPGALTVFDVASPWAELDESGARVVAFHVGQP